MFWLCKVGALPSPHLHFLICEMGQLRGLSELMQDSTVDRPSGAQVLLLKSHTVGLTQAIFQCFVLFFPQC